MITVEVVNVSGMSPPHPMSAEIDERGGTLGRSPDCTLVLADDKRAVSRVHGQISCRNGQFLIEDQGTNPLKVNGAPVGKGNSVAIKSGDRIIIGPYELEVRGARAAPPRTAAPLQPAQGWEPAEWKPEAPPPAASPISGSGSGNPFDDLFGPGSSSGAPSSSGGSPFDDLGFGAPAPSPAPAKPAAAPKPSAAASFGAFPDDFDPMAPPPSAAEPLPPAGAGLPDDAFGELLSSPQAPGSGSLDALFGLSSGSSPDPFASTPLGAPPPSHAGGTDSGLTQWIGGINKAAAAPIADKVPELNSAYQPPKAVAPAPKPELPPLDDFGAPPAAPKVSAIPPAGELPDFDLDAFGASEPAAAPTPAPAPPPASMRPAPRPAPPPAPAARPRPSGPAAPPSDLLQALMSGLNAPDLTLDELTPELMYKLGALMHEATAGTIALLNARGSVKREMRADVTMIASGRNNPLKFSPDAGLALRYLFGQPMPGFMDAEDAMRDAYSDLRAHEFGFMAGLRAALAGVLKRFEPATLESRLPDKGGINALLPMNRKAKLWDQFGELYRQISMEAEEDFHALFGREFLRAYEEHIAALERGQQRRK